ncbi:uncharacterized protein N7496_000302 [Penicillium cataractarum]|uniref:Uncharacterized protein n=1 Tax=Penicillium cataractarum TaxID=2100454 RepID=A0A9W9VU87_9EURO|nr:uncharacterized protein N7496_000302 [Penicillium cataractarum]KAJ5389234.1 hypothetical protein N7496_000302 [Penicillium cataractarum]
MRYENWDVLLFPDGTRVPIQEFKTQCFVTRDTESPYLQNPTILGPTAYLRVQGNHGHIPILTSFIPTMPRDSRFRVSIHSWEHPRPSRLIESLMQPDDVLLYEARVFVDGNCVAAGVFGQRAAWPYVIDIDREGNQDSLRFPPFHGEILEQRHWNASDELGRIKIVLAEGFSRPNRSPPFERVKDVMFFSFQHAPQHILEFSQIAWPNPQMWPQTASRTVYKVDQSADPREQEDTHAHSPRKPETRVPMTSMASMVANNPSSSSQAPIAYNNAWASGRAFPLSTSQLYPFSSAQTPSRNPRWPGFPDRQHASFIQPVRDPFVDDVAWRHRGARSSREDVPMPDYSTSSGSRAISSMTGMSFEHSKHSSMSAPMDEERYNLLIDAMTPTKLPMGTRAPSNTPSTMAVLPVKAAATPTTQVRKASGNNQGSMRTSRLHERSQPSSRDVSGSISIQEKSTVSPNVNVKSRKEGEKEKKENETDL